MIKGEHQDDLALALRLADAASITSLAYFKHDPRQWKKDDGSLATEADLAVEDALREILGAERRADSIVGEERGEGRENSRRWIIDPIDGTIDFAAGGPDWGTLIALEAESELVAAVCDFPVHKRRYFASRNGGAFLTLNSGEPSSLRVTERSLLAAARARVQSGHRLQDVRMQVAADALEAATTRARSGNHPALSVAEGTCEAAIWFVAGPWDIAAPALVVREAGGTFTNLDGKPDHVSGGAVFSNGVLHDELLRLIAGALS